MVSERLSISLAYTASTSTYGSHLRQWLCRLILASDTLVSYIAQDSGEAVGLRRLLGVCPYEGVIKSARVRKQIASVASRRGVTKERSVTPLFRNIDLLSSFITLSRAEHDLLAFGTLMAANQVLRMAAAQLCDMTTEFAIECLAVILRHPVKAIRAALRGDSVLIRSGLIGVREDPWTLDSKLILKSGLALSLLDDQEDAELLLRPFFVQAREAVTTLDDFSQHRVEIALVHNYLREALVQKTRGVNVLLYGPPGTGKTELASAIGASLNAPIYEVQSTDLNGDPAAPDDRVSSYRLCQLFLKQRQHGLVLFDEIEDLFPIGGLLSSRPLVAKSWMNRLLEANEVPTIWISNAVAHIDHAHLRRFDFAINVQAPPRSVRLRVLERATGGLGLAKGPLSELAESMDLTPALAAKIAKVTRTVQCESNRDEAARLVVESTARLLGIRENYRSASAMGKVQMQAFNTSVDAVVLADRLSVAPGPLAVCFYGPSGTGKTCFAQMTADAGERELMTRTGSDFLDPYVGGTEANIARAFSAAARTGAVLFIDEVESLIGSRQIAAHSWEVSQVNEMLVQMERFHGVVICATNYMGFLDGAAMRRFGLKVEFRYLRLEQALALLQSRYPDLATASPWLLQKLKSMASLTPGDFAAVDAHRAVLDLDMRVEDYLQHLQRELVAKGLLSGSPLGFLPT